MNFLTNKIPETLYKHIIIIVHYFNKSIHGSDLQIEYTVVSLEKIMPRMLTIANWLSVSNS